MLENPLAPQDPGPMLFRPGNRSLRFSGFNPTEVSTWFAH